MDPGQSPVQHIAVHFRRGEGIFVIHKLLGHIFGADRFPGGFAICSGGTGVQVQDIPQPVVPMDHIDLRQFELCLPIAQGTQSVLGKTAVFRREINIHASGEFFPNEGVISHADGVTDQKQIFHFMPLKFFVWLFTLLM